MNIESYLADNESILAEYKDKKKHFYATDRRFIYTLRGNFLDASYNHINSIGMKEIKHRALLAFGIILFLVGIILMILNSSIGAAVLVLGLIFIVLYFLYKKSEYTISLSSGDKILVPRTKKENAENFIKVIRDKAIM